MTLCLCERVSEWVRVCFCVLAVVCVCLGATKGVLTCSCVFFMYVNVLVFTYLLLYFCAKLLLFCLFVGIISV